MRERSERVPNVGVWWLLASIFTVSAPLLAWAAGPAVADFEGGAPAGWFGLWFHGANTGLVYQAEILDNRSNPGADTAERFARRDTLRSRRQEWRLVGIRGVTSG